MESEKKFIPWNRVSFNNKNSMISHTYKKKQFHLEKFKTPFFALINEDSTVKTFIDTVLNEGYDDAKIYISKYFVYSNDHEEIKELLKTAGAYQPLINVSFDKASNTKVKSILLMDSEYKAQSIVKVYLVNEPDMFSKWKICMITRE